MKAVELFVTFTKMGDREFGIKSDELMDVCFDWWNASSSTFDFPLVWMVWSMRASCTLLADQRLNVCRRAGVCNK